MKVSVIALLAIFSPGANAECDFCLDGVTAGDDVDIPNSGGETCGTLAEYAPTTDKDEYLCTSVMTTGQDLCCPGETAAESTNAPSLQVTAAPTVAVALTAAPTVAQGPSSCSVCSEGLTVDEGTVIPYPEANGVSCGVLIGLAPNQDESSDVCTEMKLAEAICCPSVPTATPLANSSLVPTIENMTSSALPTSTPMANSSLAPSIETVTSNTTFTNETTAPTTSTNASDAPTVSAATPSPTTPSPTSSSPTSSSPTVSIESSAPTPSPTASNFSWSTLPTSSPVTATEEDPPPSSEPVFAVPPQQPNNSICLVSGFLRSVLQCAVFTSFMAFIV